MSKSKILNVLYQSDDNYAMVSGISIASLLENNQHLDKINIFYCAYNISTKNKKKLISITRKYSNSEVQFIDGTSYHKELTALKVKPWHGVYVTWLKLLAFGDLKLKTDRVLFINGHTIINGPLDELISYDFKDNVMALSYDCLTNEHKNQIDLNEQDKYFNCGIMLINHKKWIKDNIAQQIKDHLSKKSDYVIADQDLCNVMFKNKIGLLGVEYNFSSAYYAYDVKQLLETNDLKDEYFYSYEQIMESYYSPKIIHSLFGIKGKPWEQGNRHPQRYLWNKYMRLTPWTAKDARIAQKTLNWRLYDVLPGKLFMFLYGVSVRSKFGK